MPDSGLLVTWGEIYPGCQERALRLLSEVVAYGNRLRDEGRIGAFEPFVVGAHAGGQRGFMIIRGTTEQLTNVSQEVEFRSYTVRATMLMRDVGVMELYFGEQFGEYLQIFEQQATELFV